MQSSDEKYLLIKELENENRKLQEKVTMLEHNVELLTQAVLHASKQRFGASSEKTPKIDGQYSLLGEIVDEISDEAKVINIKEHKRPIRKKGDRENLIKNLPHQVVECILEDEEAACEICDSELKVIGKKKVRSEMEFIPAKLIIKDYVQYVYKCIECGKNDLNPYDAILCSCTKACAYPFRCITVNYSLDNVPKVYDVSTRYIVKKKILIEWVLNLSEILWQTG